ncbi:Uu.00g033440.m01.CDS01 [Anthostomella pinea]|uniref:Uu.00g033440.m01.CDS01 n=1 Tax=Anthostomella pinea TaxID=933095 RepID=A0AAI8YD65_9PEZI|nr:Uu.00g033440.m01.CDS01 [Anthostomella pinea]
MRSSLRVATLAIIVAAAPSTSASLWKPAGVCRSSPITQAIEEIDKTIKNIEENSAPRSKAPNLPSRTGRRSSRTSVNIRKWSIDLAFFNDNGASEVEDEEGFYITLLPAVPPGRPGQVRHGEGSMHVILDIHELPRGQDALDNQGKTGDLYWWNNQTSFDRSINLAKEATESILVPSRTEQWTLSVINEPLVQGRPACFFSGSTYTYDGPFDACYLAKRYSEATNPVYI